MLKTKRMKIDESCSSTSTARQDTSMAVMNTSKQDFCDIRHMRGFVDKTLLIRAVLTCMNSYILLTAPRRFGKSVNITMLKRFFEISSDKNEQSRNRKLFEETLIGKDTEFMEKYCGKYPVLYLNFKSSGSVRSYDSAFEFVRNVIKNAFKSHAYLRSSSKLNDSEKDIVSQWCDGQIYKTLVKTDCEIYEALLCLAECLVKHHGRKIFLFVDEYDAICSDSVIYTEDRKSETTGAIISTAESEIKVIISFCVGALSCLLKPDQYSEFVDHAVLTGISYVMTMGLSKLTTVKSFRFQEKHAFSKFYGLTFDECKEVLSRPMIQLDSEYDTILHHYNGYQNEILSIWSVMNFLNDKMELKETEPKNYWKESGIIYDLNAALKITEVSSIITKLLSEVNNVVEIDIIRNVTYRDISELKSMLEQPQPELRNVDIFFTFLLEQGYFTIVETNEECEKMRIKIPNIEIRTEFSQKFLKFYAKTYNLDITLIRACASKFDEICDSNDEKNEEILREICNLMNKIIKPAKINSKNEATLHHIIFIIIFHCLNFKCYSEVRANCKNLRRLDLLMLREKLGIILELKNGKEPDYGLLQIKKNNYCDAFKHLDYNPDNYQIEYYILIGLSMSVDYKISLSILFNNLDYDNKRVIIN